MTTKISLLYSVPADEGAFESGYAAQPALAEALPGLDRVETSKVWPKDDGTPENLGSIAEAGVTILFSDVEP